MFPYFLAAVGSGLFYKLGQAIDDEEFEGAVVPPRVREKIIKNHVDLHGYHCLRCGKQRFDLEVDHIVPIACGGRKSWHNLQVLCVDCNRRKGATYTFLEGFRGRMK